MKTLVLVHHANQLLVTDGYEDREGITPVASATLALVQLHERLGLPASLHLSGTLIEALAWHRPDVLDAVRELTSAGLLEAVGGAFGEPILPLLTPSARRRHLRLTADVLARHLGVAQPTSAWVPERTWSPGVGTSLVEAGYTTVALDDRLLVRPEHRGEIDAAGPWYRRPEHLRSDLCRPVRDRHSGLVVAPITAALRYLVPPRSAADLELLGRLLDELPDGAVVTYADDLERTCGVAGWEPAFDRFEQFTEWVAARPELEVRKMAELLPADARDVHEGAYFELAHQHGAGERYERWAEDPRWAPYASLLRAVERDVDHAPPTPRLGALAERLLLVGQHETAWQDVTGTGERAPAPWARATASHARDAWPILHAARWAAAGGSLPTGVEVDIDRDWQPEVVLADRTAWVTVSPRHGARASLMVVRDQDQPDGRVVVGNPLNHWNFQEESHQFMRQPPAHPGALSEHDAERASWDVESLEARRDGVRLVLRRGHEVRRLALVDGRLHLCWTGDATVTVESLLSPDYLRVLEHGSRTVGQQRGATWAGVTDGVHSTWLAWGSGAAAETRYGLAGHGLPVAVRAETHLDLLLGTGPVDDDQAAAWLNDATDLLHAERLVEPLR